MKSTLVICCVFLVHVLSLGSGNASPVREKFIVHPSALSPSEGQTLTLSCFIDGPPQASIPTPSSYEWVKDGRVISGQAGQTLTLHRLSVQDEGDYQCGPPGSDVPRGIFHLDVIRGKVSPKRERFIALPSALSPSEGQTLILSCVIGGPSQASIDYPSSYEWVKDGKVIPDQTAQTLTLYRLSDQDEGDYQCGSPSLDIPREVFHLDVIHERRSPPSERVFYVDKTGSTLLGRTVTLRCYLLGLQGVNPSSYEWVKDGRVIPGATENHLTLKSLSSGHTGDYQCGDPSMDVPRRNYRLQVISTLPRPDIFKDRLPVCDHPFSLSCIIKAGYSTNGDMVYTWYKGSREIEGQSGPELSFRNVTEADAGKYTCTVRDGPESTTSPHSPPFDLTPLMKPQVCIQPTNEDSLVKGLVGEDLTLTCTVTRAVPWVPPNGYSWSFLPSHQGQLRPLEGTSKSLTLGPLTRADSGQYFCQAKNDQNYETVTLVGQGSVTVDIVYLDNISLLADINVDESDPVSIACKVDSHPIAHLAWIIDGEEVRHVIDNLDHYVIPKAVCTDSTSYTCRASNADIPDREITATTYLHVRCKQDSQKRPEQYGTIEADVAAPFDLILPDETSVVLVHPSGQDIITVHQNCSYVITSAFSHRFLHPQCDRDSHHLTFTLIHVTDKDEGYYFCRDEKQRNPILHCNQTLILKRKDVEVIHSGNASCIIGAISGALWVATAVVLIITQWRKIVVIFNQLKHNIRSEFLTPIRWRDPPAGSQVEKTSHTFERLYCQSKVYVIPWLVPSEPKATAAEEDDGDETTPFLPQTPEEAAEFTVKDLVRYSLQVTTGDDDMPSFLLHNTHLIREENILLILSRKVGVVLMVVKPVHDLTQEDLIKEAVDHLLEARKIVKKKLRGLVKANQITVAIALPNLLEADMNFIKKHSKILRFQWNVEVLLGQEREDFLQWAERLSGRPDSDVWDLSTHGLDNPDIAFKMAASKFLTLDGIYHPGNSSESTNASQSWLLTPYQMEAKDSVAKLLHVWGSPGSGKTKLLIHRAKQWLAEGKAVVLAVGRSDCDVLLAMIAREVKRDQSDRIRKKIRVCRLHSELQQTFKELRGQYPGLEICLAIDTLWDPELIRKVLQAIRSQQVTSVWSISRDSFPVIDQDLSKEAHELGWESLKLPDSIRCTEDTVELLNLLRQGSDIYYPISALTIPRARDIPKWSVVDHRFHPNHTTTTFSCDHCSTELRHTLISPDQYLHPRIWLVVCTGNPDAFFDTKPICDTMQRYGIPAKLDSHYEIVASHGSHLDSSETDMTKWLDRVLAGKDEEGSPIVHLVRVRDLAGMEKEGVLLVHWDERDNDPNCQSPEDRETRLKEHRLQWILAVARSSGQVILLLLTPSPARSLLDLREAVM